MIIDPKTIKYVTLTGRDLTIEDVIAVARFGAKAAVSEDAAARMRASRKRVEEIVKSGVPTYGINTGFGDFSTVSIKEEDIGKVQTNLIMSHCVATGDPYSTEVVRAMMLLRANALCEGFSGIRPEVVGTLVEMINRHVHPVVPQKGSLGASGDLAPLAHMVLPLIGLGEAEFEGNVLPGKTAMERAGLKTTPLLAKEGLALINGTQAMTAVGTLAYYDTLMAARTADIACGLTMEGLLALTNAFDPRVQNVRPHAGQAKVAGNIRMITEGSELLAKSQKLRVQDAYAIRCVPQVHGAIRDALDYVKKELDIEINSVTDNPIIFLDNGDVISGGNFHGEPMALAFDFLGIAASEIASISERRLERMENGALSNGLPEFLTKGGGLNSGFMICQYGAASMVSENKVYAHPASVDSIPSSANQEDHVSMGTTAARKARMIVENTLSVLAFELMAGAQAVDLRHDPESPYAHDAISPVSQKVYSLIRDRVAYWDKDREIRPDVSAMNRLVRSGELVEAVSGMLEEFE